MRFQVRGHVAVILDGVQICPRQTVFVGGVIAVVRLVKVPGEYQVKTACLHGSSLANVMRMLAEHVGRNQRDAIFGDMKAPFVFLTVYADHQAFRDFRALVDHAAA